MAGSLNGDWDWIGTGPGLDRDWIETLNHRCILGTSLCSQSEFDNIARNLVVGLFNRTRFEALVVRYHWV